MIIFDEILSKNYKKLFDKLKLYCIIYNGNREENVRKFEEFREFEIEIKLDEPVFPTSVVCKLLDIPRWVLRELDKEKIISPPREKGWSQCIF